MNRQAWKTKFSRHLKTSQNLFSAKYTYPFSKRTNLYAVGTYGNGYAFNNVKVTQLVVGLRHRF